MTLKSKIIIPALMLLSACSINQQQPCEGSTIKYRHPVAYFDFDSTKIKDEYKPSLDWGVEKMLRYATRGVYITGHTDMVGTTEYNNKLSYKRAKAIADYFTAAGVSPDRIHIEGLGKTQLVTENADEQDKNRRVEVRIEYVDGRINGLFK